MPFDPVIANPGRLRILTALVQSHQGQREFVELRRVTALTDGNLASHARRLSAAGYVAIQKQFRDGRPVTRLELTHTGRDALERHALDLLASIRHISPSSATTEIEPEPAEEWVD